jgi:hypothetical protein
MASVARRGDIVYMSDFNDLSRRQAHFQAVRVIAVQSHRGLRQSHATQRPW